MKLLLIAFLLVSLASVAQESAEYRACLDKATTQMAMNTCASEEAARVDGRLNEQLAPRQHCQASKPTLLLAAVTEVVAALDAGGVVLRLSIGER